MSENDAIYQRISHLSPQERHLLLTALSSTSHEKQNTTDTNQAGQNSDLLENFTNRGNDTSALFLDPHLNTTGFDSSLLFENGIDAFDETLLGDMTYADFGANESQNGGTPLEDSNLDTSVNVDEDVAQRASVSDSPSEEQEGSEKRKLSGDAKDTDGKKRRGDGTPKKPGRKPLTTEPTSKRKAQNRAAQRAFRERKEKHLKDLESKVESLENASKDSKNENSVLRAQIARLQVELQEYKRRLSWINNDMVGRTSYSTTPPTSSSLNPSSTGTTDFYFGTTSLPQSGLDNLATGLSNQHAITNHDTASPGHNQVDGREKDLQNPRNSSTTPSLPYTSRNGILSYTTSQTYTPESSIGNTASSSSNSVGVKPQNTQKQSVTSSTAVKMAGNQSKSASPSSCCELVHSVSNTSSPGSVSSATPDSPPFNEIHHGGKKTRTENSSTSNNSNQQHNATSNSEHTSTTVHHKPLCEGMLNESLNNSGADIGFEQFADQMPPLPDLDWFVQQNHGAFDPTLFGDYRDPQEAYLSHHLDSFINETPFNILGNDNVQGNESSSKATQPAATSNQQDDADAGCATRATSAYQKNIQGLLDHINELKRLGKWDGMPAKCKELLDKKESLMTLPDVWMRITQAEKFQKGDIDVDSLCTQFRTKACCSENGVVVKRDEFEDIMSNYE